MDRNLGARDTKFSETAVGVLQYQFGRKDPFGTDASRYGTNLYIGRRDGKITYTPLKDYHTISDAVYSPMVVFLGMAQNWTTDVSSETYVWHDYEADVANNDKSIFDPSPYGWKVAAYGTLRDITLDNSTWNDGSVDGQIGRSYLLEDDKFAYFPAHGWRDGSGYGDVAFKITATSYFSTPTNALTSYAFRASSSLVAELGGHWRNDAHSIRPVQHYE